MVKEVDDHWVDIQTEKQISMSKSRNGVQGRSHYFSMH